MVDSETSFSSSSSPMTLEELANLIGADLVGNPKHLIHYVASIDSAGPQDATFLSNVNHWKKIQLSQAGAIVVPPDTPSVEGKNYLIHPRPPVAFEKLINLKWLSLSNNLFQSIPECIGKLNNL